MRFKMAVNKGCIGDVILTWNNLAVRVIVCQYSVHIERAFETEEALSVAAIKKYNLAAM